MGPLSLDFEAAAPATSATAMATPVPAAAGRTVYSVSALNQEARTLLESGLGRIWVQGELTNLSRPSSGHWYFSLKDSGAQLRCAMFRARNVLSRLTPREGQQVVARGRVSLYEARGEYQLLVEQLEDAGVGALQRAFDELKARLAAEGLFAVERKRPLPVAPHTIGVITSPTGAAIRDILHILARRFPSARVLLHPVPVQGTAAAPAIVQALDRACARAECEVLILSRGGGSLEDLWAFNDERVARAIHRSSIPIVTGIGHEIDFTIADFVADVRAPTPSGAAELAVPDHRAWLQRLAQLQHRFSAAMRRSLTHERTRLSGLDHRLQQAHPGARLQQHAQRLDEFDARLRMAMRNRLERAGGRLEGAARALQAVSPLATLGRGFAVITRSADGTLVTSADQLQPGDTFDAQLASGSLHAQVLGKQS
ncbi:MAG TPA: exodeoxyribonuclease VII large subunit [Steroidobacteraceae bacterium]|jgi:exodeoxyribonuclease VII large subunit|nr:exodeoxyribonuclease VII large subunit [Steroidobacteraceae bacterium]